MPPRKPRREVAPQALPGTERAAAGRADPGDDDLAAAPDSALYDEGLALLEQPHSVTDPDLLASPAWMYVLGPQTDGERAREGCDDADARAAVSRALRAVSAHRLAILPPSELVSLLL